MKKLTSSVATALTAFLLVISYPCQSQNESSQRIFFDMGYALFTDYTASPVSEVREISDVQVYNPNTWTYYYPDTVKYYQSHAFHIASYIFRVRANAIQPTDNTALSISASPSLQVGEIWEKPGTAKGSVAFNFPIMAEFSFGAGSTFKSDADKGGYLGAGYQFHLSPIMDIDAKFAGKKSWGQPAFSAGYRFWLKETRLAEFNLKLGFGKNKVMPPDSYNQKVSSPISIRLAMLLFFNY